MWLERAERTSSSFTTSSNGCSSTAPSLNDKIMGRESGLEREIDVSIRTTVGDEELLYIVQCKDRAKRPADIVILGEFSAVIRDVGAAKGFLICTSGFAKSNYEYAQTLGIELFTVEDMKTDRWKAETQVPFYLCAQAHQIPTDGPDCCKCGVG
jgi:Restriction endonuclease